MRFVVDAQLPPALARWMAGKGYVSEHVQDFTMVTATDFEIWGYAVYCSAVIITKDQDFASRRSSEASGPQVVWLRCGNLRRQELLAWFERQLSAVIAAFERGDILVEVR